MEGVLRLSKVALPFRALLLALVAPLAQGIASSDHYPLEYCDGEGGVKATVGGKPVLLAFETTWPASYLLGGNEKSSGVVVGGKTRLSIPFNNVKKEDLPDGVDGVLGVDALRKTTLALDPLGQQVEFVGGAKFGLAAAERYFKSLPAWGGESKVVRLPLTRGPDGTPLLTAKIGGKEFPLVPRLTPLGSIVDKTVPHPKTTANADDWDYLNGVALPGLDMGWTAYSADDDFDQGGHGMLRLDVFGSRRVLVDLADDAMYVERLSDDGRASLFLTRMLDLPIVVRGNALMFAIPPGEAFGGEGDEIPENVEVVSIAKIAGSDWLADLRSGKPEASARLVGRLATLGKGGYDVVTLDADGNEESFTVPTREPSKTPTLRASLRAVARVLAGSPSR